jgi:hypothetical protein
MGGSVEAERALFIKAFGAVEHIQDHVAESQRRPVHRAFHNKGAALRALFEVSADLPATLQVGFLKPGAQYEGFARFSRSQSFAMKDGDLDQRGFAFRLQTGDGPQDILLSNTPISFAEDPIVFLRVATLFVESPQLLAAARLMFAVGPLKGFRILGNLLGAPDRAVAFTSQRYWSRTPFQFGDVAARMFVRPLSEVRRVASRDDPDFLSTDLAQDLHEQSRSFELCAQLFVDEANTPIENSNHLWSETVAPPIVLGVVTLPQQDLSSPDNVTLADEVEHSVSLNPWNTPCLRPLGRTNRARLAAYNRSAAHRGGPTLARPADAPNSA